MQSDSDDELRDLTLYEAALMLQNGMHAHATDGGIKAATTRLGSLDERSSEQTSRPDFRTRMPRPWAVLELHQGKVGRVPRTSHGDLRGVRTAS